MRALLVALLLFATPALAEGSFRPPGLQPGDKIEGEIPDYVKCIEAKWRDRSPSGMRYTIHELPISDAAIRDMRKLRADGKIEIFVCRLGAA